MRLHNFEWPFRLPLFGRPTEQRQSSSWNKTFKHNNSSSSRKCDLNFCFFKWCFRGSMNRSWSWTVGSLRFRFMIALNRDRMMVVRDVIDFLKRREVKARWWSCRRPFTLNALIFRLNDGNFWRIPAVVPSMARYLNRLRGPVWSWLNPWSLFSSGVNSTSHSLRVKSLLHSIGSFVSIHERKRLKASAHLLRPEEQLSISDHAAFSHISVLACADWDTWPMW